MERRGEGGTEGKATHPLRARAAVLTAASAGTNTEVGTAK
jgi:hypothetical protein